MSFEHNSKSVKEGLVVQDTIQHNPDEMDPEKNRELFCELPAKDFTFFVSHLARPDGFLKTLISGDIVSSKELREHFPAHYTKTHRQDYLGRGDMEDEPDNDYVSFAIGLPQREYTSESGSTDKVTGGLGFIQRAEDFLSRPDTTGSEAHIRKPFEHSRFDYDKLIKSEAYEEGFADVISFLKGNPFIKYLTKKHIINMLNVARKLGRLNEEYPVEIHLSRDIEDNFPRMKVSDTMVLIPESEKERVFQSLQRLLDEMSQHSDKFKELFNIDVSDIGAGDVLSRYNIYWYPQNNISEAIEFLSTHKGEFEKSLREK